MITRTLLALLFLLPACGDRALSLPDDGGTGRDLRQPAADLGALSCGDIARAVDGWLEAHLGCSADTDCRFIESRCGLRGYCGALANRDPGFEALVALWDQKGCGAAIDCAACPDTYPREPACIGGICQARTASGIGDPCAADGDCSGGTKCAKSGGFAGGYCTFKDCDHAGFEGCPSGSTCLKHDDGVSYCMRNCTPTLGACGRDAYDCCGSGVAVCAPATGGRCNPR